MQPIVISGTVRTSTGATAPYAIISVRKQNEDRVLVNIQANGLGQYISDLHNFGILENDDIEFDAISYYNDESASGDWTAAPTMTEDITLLAREDAVRMGGDRHAVILHNVGGEPFTRANPVPVESQEQALIKRYAYTGSSASPTYIGEALPGTSESASGWRIKRLVYDDSLGFPRATEESWANGSTSFDKVWDDRAGYSYS